MRWASAVTSVPHATAAVAALRDELLPRLDGNRPDLVLAFATPHYADALGRLPELIAAAFAPGRFIGCTATGVIGGGREVEDEPALAITAAHLPDVEIDCFHLEAEALPGPDQSPDAWVELLGVAPEPAPQFLLLANPTGAAGFDPRPLLMGLDYAYAQSPKIGGLASALHGNVLFLDDEVLHSGCVGLALRGDIAVDTVVAQGCRPVGDPMVITGCSGHYLQELDDRPSVEALMALYAGLPAADQDLMKTNGLFLGIASTELKQDLGHGDFLIRNVIKLDSANGIIGVGDMLRTGQTVQFHLRDADTAAEDLAFMLQRYTGSRADPGADTPAAATPAGALLFTCTGRGQHLFGHPNHDSDLFAAALGDVPMGGFFCGGEIGPVGGATHLHGYTCSFALFRPAR